MTVELSDIEIAVVNQLRRIVANRYGCLTVKVDDSKVVEIIPALPVNKKELKAAQE